MKALLFCALILAALSAGSAQAADSTPAACLEAAANAYRLPPSVLLILLSVEGGSIGHVSRNTNGTVDIGPMQVNQIWLPAIARHWHATEAASFTALRDNFCANIEAGSWILRQAMDQAHGDFWNGVGFYHSHDPGYKADYLRKVLRQALRLEKHAQNSAASGTPTGKGG
jgi:Transglycosylase SLT domain